MASQREITHIIDLSLRLGELMMSNGAGAADVSATMRAVAHRYGLRNVEIDVTFTSLSMTYQAYADAPQHVLLRQVKQRDIDYADLTLVDHLVRAILHGRGVPLADARATVASISSTGHSRPRWAVTLGWGVMCAGVAVMFGGGLVMVLGAFVAAAAIDRMQLILARHRLPFFYLQVAGGALAVTFAVLLTATGLEDDPSRVVTANIVMLLSGVGFMGALQDALSGFYITGTARMLEALLATAGIIAGISGGLTAARLVGVDIGQIEPGLTDLRALAALGIGALVAAAGFAYASYSPLRALVPIGLVGGGAIVLSRLVDPDEVGAGSVALAALLVGLVGYPISRMIKVPPLVIVVSAVVPMLPGLSIYRALSLLPEGGWATTTGLLAIVQAASVALALAGGVILGEYIAQPLSREARRLEKRLSGPRLVGPIRLRSSREDDAP